MRKSAKMVEIEKRFKSNIRDILIEYYYEKDMTLSRVGEILGIDTSTVWFWMLKFNLPAKKFTATNIPRKTGT